MDSFLFTFPSDSFHIITRTLACIFSSSIIICLLVPLLLNHFCKFTSSTILTKRHTSLLSLSPLLRDLYNLVSVFVQHSKGMLDDAQTLLCFPIRLTFFGSLMFFDLFLKYFKIHTFQKCFMASNCRILPVQVYLQASIRALNTF